jgi:hypothetical protein
MIKKVLIAFSIFIPIVVIIIFIILFINKSNDYNTCLTNLTNKSNDYNTCDTNLTNKSNDYNTLYNQIKIFFMKGKDNNSRILLYPGVSQQKKALAASGTNIFSVDVSTSNIGVFIFSSLISGNLSSVYTKTLTETMLVVNQNVSPIIIAYVDTSNKLVTKTWTDYTNDTDKSSYIFTLYNYQRPSGMVANTYNKFSEFIDENNSTNISITKGRYWIKNKKYGFLVSPIDSTINPDNNIYCIDDTTLKNLESTLNASGYPTNVGLYPWHFVSSLDERTSNNIDLPIIN